MVLAPAREMPELSSRQLTVRITDNYSFFVSESTVYRILRREGLVESPKMHRGCDRRKKGTELTTPFQHT